MGTDESTTASARFVRVRERPPALESGAVGGYGVRERLISLVLDIGGDRPERLCDRAVGLSGTAGPTVRTGGWPGGDPDPVTAARGETM